MLPICNQETRALAFGLAAAGLVEEVQTCVLTVQRYMLSDSLESEAPRSWGPDRPVVLEHMPAIQNGFRQS